MNWEKLLNLLERYVASYEIDVDIKTRMFAINERRARMLEDTDRRAVEAQEKMANMTNMAGKVEVTHRQSGL